MISKRKGKRFFLQSIQIVNKYKEIYWLVSQKRSDQQIRICHPTHKKKYNSCELTACVQRRAGRSILYRNK